MKSEVCLLSNNLFCVQIIHYAALFAEPNLVLAIVFFSLMALVPRVVSRLADWVRANSLLDKAIRLNIQLSSLLASRRRTDTVTRSQLAEAEAHMRSISPTEEYAKFTRAKRHYNKLKELAVKQSVFVFYLLRSMLLCAESESTREAFKTGLAVKAALWIPIAIGTLTVYYACFNVFVTTVPQKWLYPFDRLLGYRQTSDKSRETFAFKSSS